MDNPANDSKAAQTFEIPIPEIPSIPAFIVPNIPEEIKIEWPPVPESKHIRSFRFDVTCDYGRISEFVRAVTYRFMPQEITFVLNDLRLPSRENPIFDWVHLLIHSTDDIVIATLDENHIPVYENEFLGCRLKEHSCPMDYAKDDVATHHITVKYDHVNINRIKRKESDV